MTIWTAPSRALRAVALAMFALVLAGCGTVPTRINPPVAKIQQLAIDADGTWRLQLRLHNFSNVPMRFVAVTARLDVADTHAGDITVAPAMDIPGESADVVQLTLAPSPAGRAALERGAQGGKGIAYFLEGTIRTEDPDKKFEFTHDSALNPVPGRPGEFR